MDNIPNPNKTLIIKTGHSETFEKDVSTFVSYGDVLFSTVILHPFKNDHVTWLTDEKCLPLLEGNPYIDRLLPYNLNSVLQLQVEYFDTVINLEKVPGICAFASSVHERPGGGVSPSYGFRFNPWLGEPEPYSISRKALNMKRKPFVESLFEVIDRKWDGEEYVLGYQPQHSERDSKTVGLNYLVGPRWPTKAWSQHWFFGLRKSLEASGYAISMQKGEKDLKEYMDWIGSCGLIVTGDTLGMHLAIALRKKVVALFGPTSPDRVHLYGRGVKLNAFRDCVPCYEAECKKHKEERTCMDDISVQRVQIAVEQLLNEEEES